MRNIRIYVNQPLETGQTVLLAEEAHNHCSKVLRLRVGDEVIIFNGNGYDYKSIIRSSSKAQTTVFIHEKISVSNESPLQMTLLIALLKGEAIDRCMQKAVELGVTAIVPFSCTRSERRIPAERVAKKWTHWQGILRASAMQCGRAILPTLSEPLTFSEAICLESDGHKWIFSPHDKPKPICEKKKVNKEITLLIGPEGGFTPEEVTEALECGFITQSLGPRILRADTAAIAAMVRAQMMLGDLG